MLLSHCMRTNCIWLEPSNQTRQKWLSTKSLADIVPAARSRIRFQPAPLHWSSNNIASCQSGSCSQYFLQTRKPSAPATILKSLQVWAWCEHVQLRQWLIPTLDKRYGYVCSLDHYCHTWQSTFMLPDSNALHRIHFCMTAYCIWYQILRSRLCRSQHPCNVYLTSNISRKVLPEEQCDLNSLL